MVLDSRGYGLFSGKEGTHFEEKDVAGKVVQTSDRLPSFSKLLSGGSGGQQQGDNPQKCDNTDVDEGEDQQDGNEGTPAKRRKPERAVTDFDKIDAVSSWGKELYDVREDVEKVKSDAAGHLSRWAVAEKFLSDVVENDASLAELDTYKELQNECVLTKSLKDQLACVVAVIGLSTASKHMEIANVEEEEQALQSHLSTLDKLPGGGEDILKKVTTFNKAFVQGKGLIQVSQSFDALRTSKLKILELKASLRSVVIVGRQKIRELAARCQKFEKKVDALKASAEDSVAAPGKAEAKRGRKRAAAAEAWPPICCFDITGLDDQYKLKELDEDLAMAMIKVALGCEITGCETGSDGEADAIACLQKGFLVSAVACAEALGKDGEVEPRVAGARLWAKMAPSKASAKRGQIFAKSQDVTDGLQQFVPSSGPHRLLSRDALLASGMKEDDCKKIKSVAIWAQRGEPEGRYIGTEFGEVGCLRLTFSGKRKIGVICVDLLCAEFQQKGEHKQWVYDSVIQKLESSSAAEVKDMTEKGIIKWTMATAKSLVYIPQGHIVVDVTVGSAPAIGVKMSTLLRGHGVAGMRALENLYKANGKTSCAETCAAIILAASATGARGDSLDHTENESVWTVSYILKLIVFICGTWQIFSWFWRFSACGNTPKNKKAISREKLIEPGMHEREHESHVKDMIYITEKGYAFHTSADCERLSRAVTPVSSRSLCKTCAARDVVPSSTTITIREIA